MIEVLGVSKWYRQIAALTDVRFEIDTGVVGLVGRNGAGKSTLIKLLAGLLRPSHGEIRIADGPPTNARTRRQIGLCPDIDAFYEELSGVDFVSWMLRLDGEPRRRADARAAEVLVGLGLEGPMRRPIRTYSKGMRQRVKLAQALAHEPAVVLLDEPMTGLDPVARRELGEKIEELGAKGVCVLVSSHVLHELESLVGRVLLIHQGRLVADGAVGELRTLLSDRPHHLELRSTRVRELAARLCDIPVVRGVRLRDSAVEVETDGGGDLFRLLTEIGAGDAGMIDEIRPLDSGLEAVFGYLVDRPVEDARK